jgi:hypothetical protein
MSYLPPLQRGTEGDLLLAARIKSPLAKGVKALPSFGIKFRRFRRGRPCRSGSSDKDIPSVKSTDATLRVFQKRGSQSASP